jgi:hypothetical protein
MQIKARSYVLKWHDRHPCGLPILTQTPRRAVPAVQTVAGVHRKCDKFGGFLETFGAAGCRKREVPGAICASLAGRGRWLHDVYGL